MCRLLGYLGPPVPLDQLVIEPPHSLVVQAYAPKELEVALLNADGFGLGWYSTATPVQAFTYRNPLPIWNDANLAPLCRYIKTGCGLAYVRSATPGQGVDISNCQPFQAGPLLFTHNGYIKDFHATLYRPMGRLISDRIYGNLRGSTDSESIWGLVLSALSSGDSSSTLDQALEQTLATLAELAYDHNTPIAANVLISDGQRLVGTRFASHHRAPSLYWLHNDSNFPEAVIIASEPLFPGAWTAFPDSSLFTVDTHCDVQFRSLSQYRRPDPG